jgi:hypothetical protein
MVGRYVLSLSDDVESVYDVYCIGDLRYMLQEIFSS